MRVAATPTTQAWETPPTSRPYKTSCSTLSTHPSGSLVSSSVGNNSGPRQTQFINSNPRNSTTSFHKRLPNLVLLQLQIQPQQPVQHP